MAVRLAQQSDDLASVPAGQALQPLDDPARMPTAVDVVAREHELHAIDQLVWVAAAPDAVSPVQRIEDGLERAIVAVKVADGNDQLHDEAILSTTFCDYQEPVRAILTPWRRRVRLRDGNGNGCRGRRDVLRASFKGHLPQAASDSDECVDKGFPDAG